MKMLRGKHHFKSYKELCEALGIEPAPRGAKREEQKQKIQRLYEMKVQANNSIDLTRIPQKTVERQKKLDQEQIRVIDGREVDLGSNLLYQDTHIDQLILFRALHAEDKTNTKEGFVTSCFERSKFFKELMVRNGVVIKKYSPDSLRIVHDLVVSRLYAMVNTRLLRFEKKEYIQIDRFYLLKNGDEADAEEVKPFVQKALREMGLKTEFQAYLNKESREKFLQLRSDYYEEVYGTGIVCKRFIINSLVPEELRDCDILEYEDEIVHLTLTNKDIQVILTSFFDIFREKVVFDFEKSLKPVIGKGRPRKATEEERQRRIKHADEVREIVNTYCAYMNNPLYDKAQAFYSIKELEDYYGETIEFRTALNHTKGLENEKFENGDISHDYNEVNGDGKKQYDFYVLSNLAEEDAAPVPDE